MEKDLDWWLKMIKHHISKIYRAPRFFLVLFICNLLNLNAVGLLKGVGGTNREQKDVVSGFESELLGQLRYPCESLFLGQLIA